MVIIRYYPDPDQPDYGTIVTSNLIISQIIVKHNRYGHDIIKVWNRGGCSGELIVNVGDGERLADKLLTLVDSRQWMKDYKDTSDEE